MTTLLGKWRCRLMGLSREETSYARRGFRGATVQMRDRLEQVGEAFVNGYHAALRHGLSASLDHALVEVGTEMRGFAYEGAAMGLALLDALSLRRRDRVGEFLRGTGGAHAYMVHVGVGWVWARMPLGLRQSRRGLDPLLSWLTFDGWGFHEGFFRWPEYLAGGPRPKRLSGYEQRVFDQGLGRSFWFVNGGNAELIVRTINSFPVERQADFWSGIGLAATYAGIVDEATLAALIANAGQHRSRLAQGAAFAAKARQRAGNATGYTELATGVLCEMSVQEAASLCDTTLENLPASGDLPAYEIWRQRIQNHFDHACSHPRLQLLEI